MSLRSYLALALAACAGIAEANFISDNFDSQIGSQWTWFPGRTTDATTASLEVVGGAATLTAAKGSDLFWHKNDEAYIEQPIPEGETWEIVTRLVDFIPTAEGFRHAYNRAGIGIFQDDNHWINGHLSSSFGGSTSQVWNGWAEFGTTTTLNNTTGRVEHMQAVPAPGSSFFMRLQKTHQGYMISCSTDNQEPWIPMTPLLRNPHSADGSLTGTIRLFTSSGAADATRPVRPASFDYALLQPLAAPVPFANDEFDTNLDARWVTNRGRPVGDEVLVTGGKLTMLPADRTDFTVMPNWQFTESGALASMDAPDSEVFSLYTRVGPTIFDTQAPLRGHGIRLWQNQNSWIGIRARKNAPVANGGVSINHIEALFEEADNTTRSEQIEFSSATPTEPAPEFLRVDRSGSLLRVQYSSDGVIWTPAFANQYQNGWVPFNLQEGPLKVQLFSRYPNSDITNLVPSEFNFIRQIEPSSAENWQLLY